MYVMYVCMYACMHVCMYVYFIYLYIHSTVYACILHFFWGPGQIQAMSCPCPAPTRPCQITAIRKMMPVKKY